MTLDQNCIIKNTNKSIDLNVKEKKGTENMAPVPFYRIETVMEKEDYKKFLYTTTFTRNKSALRFLAVMSLIGAILLAVVKFGFGIKTFFVSWAVMFACLYVIAWIKVEYNYRKKISIDDSGVFGSVTTIEFFENYMTMESTMAEGRSVLDYGKFFRLLEMRQYFVFYYSKTMATIVRKKDMDSINVQEFRQFIAEKFEGKYQKI